MAAPLPRLVSPRAVETLDAVRSVTGGGFDADAWHVMNERDNALITDEVLYGVGSDRFVYHFPVQGQKEEVSGISVIGARHLAHHYRGLKHRIVGSVSKTGALFEYRAFPFENFAGDTRIQIIPELEREDDFYSVVVEVTDIKTGNSIMVEVREAKAGKRQDGSTFERPFYDRIAQSKAYRNAVLALIPQDVQIRWKAEMLKLKKGESITGSVIEEKRANVLRFAAGQSLALDRRRLDQLTLDQIAGLGDAAREGKLPAFAHAAAALGLTMTGEAPVAEPEQTPPPRQRRTRSRSEPPTNNEPPPEADQADHDADQTDHDLPQQTGRVRFEE